MAEQDEVEAAFEAGKTVGMDETRQAGECPIGHVHPQRREAWMSGFGAGRIEAGISARRIVDRAAATRIQSRAGDGYPDRPH